MAVQEMTMEEISDVSGGVNWKLVGEGFFTTVVGGVATAVGAISGGIGVPLVIVGITAVSMGSAAMSAGFGDASAAGRPNDSQVKVETE